MTASGHQPEAFATPFGNPLEGRVILSVVDAWELVWIHNWGRFDSQPGSTLTESNSLRRRRGPAPHRPILIDHGWADWRCTYRGAAEWPRSAAAVMPAELVHRSTGGAAGQHPAYPAAAVVYTVPAEVAVRLLENGSNVTKWQFVTTAPKRGITYRQISAYITVGEGGGQGARWVVGTVM